MESRINKRLYLVIPIEREDGSLIYTHSAPLKREVFDQNAIVLAKTFAAIHQEGLGAIAGPRVAFIFLKKIAEQMGNWEEIEKTLVEEIRRLTNVMVPGDRGWETLPYREALQKNIISPDDAAEVDNAVTFFIVASAMHRRAILEPILRGAATLWGGEIVSLNSTEYANSLPMLTETVNTGEKTKPLQVPS